MINKDTVDKISDVSSNLSFLLKEGPNTFGSNPRNDLIFPSSVAGFAGIFFLKNNRVTIRTSEMANITYNNEPIDNAVIYENGNGLKLKIGELRFQVIFQSDRLGISIEKNDK